MASSVPPAITFTFRTRYFAALTKSESSHHLMNACSIQSRFPMVTRLFRLRRPSHDRDEVWPSPGARAGAHCRHGADAAGRRHAMATATRPRAPVALERGRGRCVRRGPLVRRRVLRTSPHSAWCARRCGPSFRARDGCGAAWYATSIFPSLAPRARPRGPVTRRARGRVPHRDPWVLAAPSARVDRRMRWRGKCAANATRRAHPPGALPDMC